MNSFLKYFFIILILIPAVSFTAEKSLADDREIKTITLDPKEVKGKLKAGVVLGYPWGLTMGYRLSNFLELNGVIGSDYHDLTAGINGLFTLVNIKISDEIFPFSVGPALNTHFDHHDNSGRYHDRDDEYTKVDLLGVARIEYSFKQIPLNLFLEGGFGVQIYRFAETAGSFGIGVRYIF